MGRPRKLTAEVIEQAAADRRNGMSWRKLGVKYNCSVNTLRFSLSEYSSEFAPIPSEYWNKLENRLTVAEQEIENLKFQLHTIQTSLKTLSEK